MSRDPINPVPDTTATSACLLSGRGRTKRHARSSPGKLAQADPYTATPDLHRTVSQKRRPGRIAFGMTVENHITILKLRFPGRVKKCTVRHEIGGTVATIPEGFGIVRGPGPIPGVLGGVPLVP